MHWRPFRLPMVFSLLLLSVPSIPVGEASLLANPISTTPRCGVRDLGPTGSSRAVSRYAYFPGQPRWARPTPIRLSYALSPTATVDYIDRSEMEAVMRRSFGRWARVIPVSFHQSKEYEAADVKVGFYGGDHGDGEPFDGVLGVLAHAFSPESGRLHLDKAERWAVDFGREKSEVAVDLESVLTHEIGHVLGLAHSAVKEAVMYPSLSPRTKKVELRVDDVKGVQALYGSNPNFTFSTLLESDISSASTVGRIGGGLRFLFRICTLNILWGLILLVLAS
ncbi:hypothetical protein HPP92_014052 [Vanilla planifolia]|uniref:Peptidase metallopeptidase domain-containing protein n=1 Tax=Vanilla planifolia TaxID=51239 RepID=A0A835QLL1_VANPL|nr:hypothetical protein HPP92_014492 [Vanilla planifolia]KAG0474366.1 hypothetical protein HPP92_014052 [Vanilla planifolia]